MPDEPTNGSARARRRHGLPPRASALVLLAFSLFVLSGIVYVQSIPSLLPAPEQSAPAGEQGEPGSEGHGDVNQGQSGSGAGAADQGSSGSGDKGGEQPQEGDLQGASVEGAHAQGEPSDHSASDAGPDAPAAGSDESPAADGSSEPPSSNGSAPPAGNSGQGNGGNASSEDSTGDDVFSSSPTPEEEAAFHAFLAGKASAVTGYVSQANACAADFESTCRDASLPARRESRQTCASLSRRLFSEYIAVRDYVRSNYSQYCDEQERLIGAYRCLASYVGCYVDAWDVNVSYETPGDHVSEFTAPLASCDSYMAEFHSYYDGLVL